MRDSISLSCVQAELSSKWDVNDWNIVKRKKIFSSWIYFQTRKKNYLLRTTGFLNPFHTSNSFLIMVHNY